MSFPLTILRGQRAKLEFIDLAALRQWLAAENQAWAWLLDNDWSEAANVAEQVMARQCAALESLRGEAEASYSGTEADAQAARLRQTLQDGYTGPTAALCRDDAGVVEILAEAAQAPLKALGMLAQALGLADSANEAQDVVQGRLYWMHMQPERLRAELHARLQQLAEREQALAQQQAQLIEGLDELERTQERKAAQLSTSYVLRELDQSRRANSRTLGWLAGLMFLWLVLAVLGLWLALAITHPAPPSLPADCLKPGPLNPLCQVLAEQAKTQVWRQWGERLALFAFVMTVFGWGMRWLGGMLQDAWRAGQSAARRWATLSVVLADEKRKLVGNGDADLARIRQEVFGDTPASKPDEKKPEPTLELPSKQLGELADVLKKIRDLFSSAGK